MIINIHATGIDMTDALNQYATEKAQSLAKFFENITQVDITIGTDNNHHNNGKKFFSEMNVYVPGNKLVVKKYAEDQYKAIDKVKDHLKVEFEKLKGKMRNIDRNHIRDQKAYQPE